MARRRSRSSWLRFGSSRPGMVVVPPVMVGSLEEAIVGALSPMWT